MEGGCKGIEGLTLRSLTPADDLAALTAMLHRAYGTLAARGMRFLASHQDVATTARRASKGECVLAEIAGIIVGTIVFRPPGASGTGTPWYTRADVAAVGQFAVEPAWQRRGIGSALMNWAEGRAVEVGAAEIALDTAETAEELIRFYLKRGYRFIEYVTWTDVVNYRSVVLSKTLKPCSC